MPNDRQYEFVYVLAPTVANAEVEAIQGELDEQIRKLGGSVENTDLWGRRKLAYPIGNFTEGIYVVQLLRGPGEMVTELERRLRVKDDVLRYLTVRVDDDLRKVRRVAEKKKADAERRRARRPQEAPATQPAAEPAENPRTRRHRRRANRRRRRRRRPPRMRQWMSRRLRRPRRNRTKRPAADGWPSATILSRDPSRDIRR